MNAPRLKKPKELEVFGHAGEALMESSRPLWDKRDALLVAILEKQAAVGLATGVDPKIIASDRELIFRELSAWNRMFFNDLEAVAHNVSQLDLLRNTTAAKLEAERMISKLSSGVTLVMEDYVNLVERKLRVLDKVKTYRDSKEVSHSFITEYGGLEQLIQKLVELKLSLNINALKTEVRE